MWAEAAYNETVRFGRTFPPQSDGRSAQAQYVAVYAVIIVLSVVATLVRSLWAGRSNCVPMEQDYLLQKLFAHRLSFRMDSCPQLAGALAVRRLCSLR